MRVVVIGAGSGRPVRRVPPRPRRATTSPWSSARRSPGGRAGVLRPRRLPLRHRADRADHAGPARTPPSGAVGGDPEPCVPMRRLDPAYRAVLRRRQRAARPCRHGRAHARGDPHRRAATPDAAGFDRFRRLARAALPGRDADTSSTTTTTPRSTCALARRARRRLLRLGGVRPARRGGATRSSTDERLQPALQLPGDVRRAGARTRPWPLYAVITYMDTVDGVYFPEGGMHAVPRAMAQAADRRPGARSATAIAVERILRRSDGAGRRGRDRPAASGSRRRRGRAPSTCRWPTRSCCPACRAPRAARTRRVLAVRAWSGTSACAARPPPAPRHHNIHFGDEWDGAFEALIERRRAACPTRRVLVTVPSLDDPTAAPPGGSTTLYVLEPVPQPRAADRLARARRGPMRERPARLPRGAAATRPTSSSRSCVTTRWTGRRRAWQRGTPFALAHTFLQTGPFRPGERRPPGAGPGVRRLRHACRASACRWCWSRGRLAAERVGVRGGRPTGTAYGGPMTRPRSPPEVLAAGYAGARGSPASTAPPTTGARCCCRAVSASTCTPSTRSAGSPTTSSTTRRARAPSPATRGRAGRRSATAFFADLDRRRSRRPGAWQAVVPHGRGPSTSTRRVLPRFLARDGAWTSPVARTRRGTTCSATWTARPP